MADSKIILITGANTGIGFEVVKALYSADKPYTVLVGSRTASKAQDAISAIQTEFPSSTNQLVPLVVDIESDESIQKAHDEVASKFGKLDALVNNAGAQFDRDITSGALTEREAWNKAWNVNTAGTQVTTTTFTPLLLKSGDPRILFVTSGASSLNNTVHRKLRMDHSPDAGWPKTGISVTSYRSAKTGLNMLMREWDRLLKNDGVKVWAVSPGLLATGLGGSVQAMKAMGAEDASVAGPFFRAILEGERDGDVGRVVTRAGVQEW
ncbi:putative short chain dehydrogenase [Aspergillus lucknowensis]|uniref:NAD(P)-binding protein n=1 Tax=Aspergillus lucknowensis TaxID=176173 RepID=A0ABR4M050_9EURO